jgi:Amt family ammonium transporter
LISSSLSETPPFSLVLVFFYIVRFAMVFSTVQQAWDACDKTDTAFILVCSVFCWPIIPAVGLAYSGYSTRRSGLASFIPSVLSVGICSIQWWAIGYSLAYGEGSGVIGDLKYALHRGVLAEPVGTIPAILFSEFQLIFCATVCAIAVGGSCERGRLLPLIPFIFVSSDPQVVQE